MYHGTLSMYHGILPISHGNFLMDDSDTKALEMIENLEETQQCVLEGVWVGHS